MYYTPYCEQFAHPNNNNIIAILCNRNGIDVPRETFIQKMGKRKINAKGTIEKVIRQKRKIHLCMYQYVYN